MALTCCSANPCRPALPNAAQTAKIDRVLEFLQSPKALSAVDLAAKVPRGWQGRGRRRSSSAAQCVLFQGPSRWALCTAAVAARWRRELAMPCQHT